jgi:hypothetical protein
MRGIGHESMNTDEFAVIAQNVVATDGFEDFQPTACFPERRAVRTLVGLPSDEDPKLMTLEWAADISEAGEEFLVAFKCDVSHFKVIRQVGGSRESNVYAIAQQALAADARKPSRG